MGGERRAILLVEDNPGDARLIREMLVGELDASGFEMRVAPSLATALGEIGEALPEVVLLDLSLPDSWGLDTLYRMQVGAPTLPMIVLTGNEDQQLALAAVKAGAQDYLLKNDLSGGLLTKAMAYAIERKQAEASLRVSEARFRSLAELSSDWYWEQDAEHRLTFLSDGFQEKSGIDPSALIGRTWWDLPPAADAPRDVLRGAVERREAFQDVLVRWGLGDDDAIHLSVSGIPVHDGRGFQGFRGLGKDVSARERAAAALRGSEERYRRMVDDSRDGILMTDMGDRVTFANKRMCTMLGYAEAELAGVPLARLLESDGDDDGRPEGGRACVFRRRDGSPLRAVRSAWPVRDAQGGQAATLSVVTDVAEFRRREERVRELASLSLEKDEAERANAAKSRFIAAVSHDLRQPLHALGLFIDDLGSLALPSAGAELVGNMQAALGTTQSLLDGILMMSRLESGMVAPNVMDVPLEPVFSRLRLAFSALASKKGLRLVVRPTAAVIRSDPALVERMLANLVSNAIRYTPEGGVVVGCRRSGAGWCAQVWDTGAGIPSEHHEAIFQEFFRIERKPGGLGLGLAIVRSCSRLLGHEVKVRSTPGRGSRFAIALPAGEATEPEAWSEDPLEDEASGEAFRGLRVLVIDDDPLILERTCRLLERWGCVVLPAASGPQAEALMEHENARVDLVVSDLRLDAGEIGTDVVLRLRQRFRPNLPALLLTGDTSLGTWRQVRRSGLTLLYKPVPPGRLRTVMNGLVAR